MLLYSRARTFSQTKVLHLTFHKRQLWRRNFVLLLIQPMMIRACFWGNSNQISEPQKVKLCFLGISVLCVDFSIPPVKTICFQSSSRLRDVVFRVHHMAKLPDSRAEQKGRPKTKFAIGRMFVLMKEFFLFWRGNKQFWPLSLLLSEAGSWQMHC